MRIAFILSKFPSISESFVLNQITGIIDRGHEVWIYAEFDPQDKIIHPDIKKYDLLHKTIYYKPPTNLKKGKNLLYNVTQALSTHPAILLKSLFNSVFHKSLLKNRGIKGKINQVWHFLKWVLILDKTFLEKNFDLIYCHFGTNGVIGAFLKNFTKKAKLVTTFHAYELSKMLNIFPSDIYRIVFRNSEVILPISHYWKKKLIKLGCPAKKIRVHHMGINPLSFPFKRRVVTKNTVINFLTVSRLVEKKGHVFALDAFKQLKMAGISFNYIIIGSGPMEEKIKELMTSYGLEEQVHVRGRVPQKELIESYRNSMVFLLPSVTSENGDMEGIPVVLMEAMAMGEIVVSTFHSGIPELVKEGHTGFLVSEKNSNELAEKLKFLIKNPNVFGDVCNEARKVIETDFNINILNDTLEQIFLGIIEK
ncbi:MAG: glycosyltransferase [Promethearchaeota archaeon]